MKIKKIMLTVLAASMTVSVFAGCTDDTVKEEVSAEASVSTPVESSTAESSVQESSEQESSEESKDLFRANNVQENVVVESDNNTEEKVPDISSSIKITSSNKYDLIRKAKKYIRPKGDIKIYLQDGTDKTIPSEEYLAVLEEKSDAYIVYYEDKIGGVNKDNVSSLFSDYKITYDETDHWSSLGEKTLEELKKILFNEEMSEIKKIHGVVDITNTNLKLTSVIRCGVILDDAEIYTSASLRPYKIYKDMKVGIVEITNEKYIIYFYGKGLPVSKDKIQLFDESYKLESGWENLNSVEEWNEFSLNNPESVKRAALEWLGICIQEK